MKKARNIILAFTQLYLVIELFYIIICGCSDDLKVDYYTLIPFATLVVLWVTFEALVEENE